MTRPYRTLLATLTLLLACAGCERRQVVDADLAFVDVTVIPMMTDRVLERQTVLVEDGRIVAIAPAGQIEPGAKTRRIDARGKFLIPGLADMHVHVWSEPDLPLYVANGVTLVRNLWGGPETLALRRRVESGEVIGPRIVTAGQLVDGDPPIWGDASAVAATAEQARALMDEQQADGFDFFKIYEGLSLEIFDAIGAHSEQSGLPFGGHVPQQVPLDHALRSGISSIEHLTGWDEAERVADGPLKSRAEFADRPERIASEAALARRIRSGELRWDQVFDMDKRRELAMLAARHGVTHVPTLIVLKKIATTRRQAEAELARPEMRYISPFVRAMWNPDKDFRLKDSSDEELELRHVYFEAALARVKALSDAGAPLVAGSDAPNPFVLHGFAIHEELALLHEAGLSPYDALVAATRTPAELVGEPDEGGTVEVGRRADLVLLHANPLEIIAATRDIAGVVLRGRWLPEAELDAMLETIAASHLPPEDWFADLAALENAAAAQQYLLFLNDTPYGAERLSASARDGQQTTVAQRITRLSGVVTETVRYRIGDAGSLVGLVYTRSASAGAVEGRASVEGNQLFLSGRSVDGSEVAQSVDLAEDVIVVCALAACLGPVIDALEGLAPGETRELEVFALEAFGGLRFEPESWSLTRQADEQKARVYEGTARRRSEEIGLRLTVDASGLKTQRLAGHHGITEARRQEP